MYENSDPDEFVENYLKDGSKHISSELVHNFDNGKVVLGTFGILLIINKTAQMALAAWSSGIVSICNQGDRRYGSCDRRVRVVVRAGAGGGDEFVKILAKFSPTNFFVKIYT
jgi:hypothetical protein